MKAVTVLAGFTSPSCRGLTAGLPSATVMETNLKRWQPACASCALGTVWFACSDPSSHAHGTHGEATVLQLQAGGAGRALYPSRAASPLLQGWIPPPSSLLRVLVQRSHGLERCSSSTAVPWQPAHTCNVLVSNNNPPTLAWEYWWDWPELGWRPP